MDKKLKPCPFCGQQPKIDSFRSWFRFYRITCECGLQKDYICDEPDKDKENEDIAIMLWNTRRKESER
jgi:Lar family restriction alleviation protein